jgi:hypothetical protein
LQYKYRKEYAGNLSLFLKPYCSVKSFIRGDAAP